MSEKKPNNPDLGSNLELHRIKLSQFIDALKSEQASPKSIRAVRAANSIYVARNSKVSQAKR